MTLCEQLPRKWGWWYSCDATWNTEQTLQLHHTPVQHAQMGWGWSPLAAVVRPACPANLDFRCMGAMWWLWGGCTLGSELQLRQVCSGGLLCCAHHVGSGVCSVGCLASNRHSRHEANEKQQGSC